MAEPGPDRRALVQPLISQLAELDIAIMTSPVKKLLEADIRCSDSIELPDGTRGERLLSWNTT